MPKLLKTICQYIAEDRKKDTIYMVFNSNYNKAVLGLEEVDDIVDESKTDYKTREKFINWMNKNLPNVKLVDIYDFVSPYYLIYPYLGSIAIDVDIDSEEYKKILEKFDNPEPFGELTNGSTILWVLSYEEAVKRWKIKKERMEMEF